jgi:hypothetical protein
MEVEDHKFPWGKIHAHPMRWDFFGIIVYIANLSTSKLPNRWPLAELDCNGKIDRA